MQRHLLVTIITLFRRTISDSCGPRAVTSPGSGAESWPFVGPFMFPFRKCKWGHSPLLSWFTRHWQTGMFAGVQQCTSILQYISPVSSCSFILDFVLPVMQATSNLYCRLLHISAHCKNFHKWFSQFFKLEVGRRSSTLTWIWRQLLNRKWLFL